MCMDARGIPPTYPFHLAKAYAAPTSAPRARSETAGKHGGAQDSVELSRQRSPAVNSLVAGKVSAPVNFAAGPASAGDALPMYRHPADKNAAATGVSVGRSLDVNG